MELSLSDIQRLPKTDLHVHLDGSLRLATMLALAEEQGIALPADTPEALAKALLDPGLTPRYRRFGEASLVRSPPNT